MSDVTIFHNPRCSKSRQTLAILEDAGIQPKVVEYLKTPPDKETLDKLLRLLGKQPQDIVRRKEKTFKDLDLADQDLGRDEWLDILTAHPILIERPIVVKGDQARLGRPPEQVREIL